MILDIRDSFIKKKLSNGAILTPTCNKVTCSVYIYIYIIKRDSIRDIFCPTFIRIYYSSLESFSSIDENLHTRYAFYAAGFDS